MSESENRRQYERRPLAEKLFGYLDGQRFDLSSANISEGGLFLRFDAPERVALGTRLALVFRREQALRDRIFLVANVVRHQADPAGLGLAWTKAVAGGERRNLARFLEMLLRLPYDTVMPAIQREPDSDRIVYRFPSAAEPVATVLPAEATARGVVEVAPRFEPPPPPPDAGQPDVAGPVTQQITVDAVRAPARLAAALRTPSKTVRGTIVALGARGLVLEVASLLTGPFDRLEVGFKVPNQQGESTLTCVTRLVAVEPLDRPGVVALDLAIESLDEGSNIGVLRSYVRWLHHRAVIAN